MRRQVRCIDNMTFDNFMRTQDEIYILKQTRRLEKAPKEKYFAWKEQVVQMPDYLNNEGVREIMDAIFKCVEDYHKQNNL